MENPDFNEDSEDFLPFADKVKECLGPERYYSVLYETFKPKDVKHKLHHQQLCKLPFKAITTTNYDLVLESALNSISQSVDLTLFFEGSTATFIHDFLMSLNIRNNPERKVVHLHGIYRVNDSIVLSASEYQNKYGFKINRPEESLYDKVRDGMSKDEFQDSLLSYGYEWPLGRKLLWALLATRRVVFVGFGMSDPYFRKMLEEIKSDLSTFNTESHFLVLRITEKDKAERISFALRLKRDYGIQTVFYFDNEGDYSGLPKFIEELDAINVYQAPQSRIIEVEPQPTTGNLGLTEKLMKTARKQHSNEN